MPAQSSGVTTSANAKESGRMKEDVMGSIKKKLQPKTMGPERLPSSAMRKLKMAKMGSMGPKMMDLEKMKPLMQKKMPVSMPSKEMLQKDHKAPMMMDSMMGKLKAKKVKTI